MLESFFRLKQILDLLSLISQMRRRNGISETALFVGTGGNVSKAFQIGSRDATPVQLFTNDISRVLVDSSGNVGIGTTNPGQLFTVGASNQFTVNSSGDLMASSSAR